MTTLRMMKTAPGGWTCFHGWVWSVAMTSTCVYTCYSNAIAGETSLDRLANALGGKAILPHIISNIPSMLQSGELNCSLALSLNLRIPLSPLPNLHPLSCTHM